METGTNPWEMLDDAMEVLKEISERYHSDMDFFIPKSCMKRIELLMEDYYGEGEEE